MVEERFRAVFEGNPDVNELLPPAAGLLRRWRPTLCLNLHGGTRSAWMTALSGARYRAGFGHFRHRFVYNVRIPRAQEILGVERKVHTAEHLASAMFYLGAAVTEVPRAKLYANPGTDASVHAGQKQALATDSSVPGVPAVIHAVAAAPEKTWRADGFLKVADQLRHSGLEPVFIGAAGDDLAAFRGWRTLHGASLSEIKSLLAGAALFVGNDSGPAHMAAAFGLPSVVIFPASDPAIWGPWRTPCEVLSGPGVSVTQVLEALARLRVPA